MWRHKTLLFVRCRHARLRVKDEVLSPAGTLSVYTVFGNDGGVFVPRISLMFILLLLALPLGVVAQDKYVESIPGTDYKIEMLPIPAGTFTMGSPASEAKRNPDEGPQHEVKLKPFWMSKVEITWEIYEQFARKVDITKLEEEGKDIKKQPENIQNAHAVTRPTPPYADPTFGLGRDGQPALCFTHHAAMEFCRWLSANTGKVYRLPTEAEWEYACRAGTKTVYSFGDDAAKLGEYAWFTDNSDGKPHLVATKKPNAWGLYDMYGNVAEWCTDQYDAKFYETAKGTVESPVNLPSKKQYPYVARGGSWDDEAIKLRSAARRGSDKDWSRQDPQIPQSIWWHTDATFIGFRVVRAVEEQENLKGLKSPVVKGEGDD